jgi:hypothetical protein
VVERQIAISTEALGSASPYLLVQQARSRKIVYLGGNTGLCQNPGFRHTTGMPKDGLARSASCIVQG